MPKLRGNLVVVARESPTSTYYYYGFNQKEIAEKLDTPEGTVFSRLHTAKKKLQLLILERYGLS